MVIAGERRGQEPKSIMGVIVYLRGYHIGVQVNTNDIIGRVAQLKIAGINTNNERARSVEDIRQCHRTERDKRTLP